MPNVKSNPYILKADKLESQTNKVTSLLVQEDELEGKYPSALAVVDLVETVSSKTYSGVSISEENTDGSSILYRPREADDELRNAKVGDFYINTEKNNVYQCIALGSDFDESSWIRLNPFVDRNYNHRSAKAQSGLAVAQALENKADKSQIGDIEAALDAIIAEQESIIAIQNALIGGDSV